MPSIFHLPGIELAVELQKRSKEKFDAAPNDLVRDALFVLTHDGTCVHQAVGCLADAGWPGPGAALLRTLMDINISGLAIANSALPPMAAFRYFYSGFRRYARDQSFSAPVRRHMFHQIRQRIGRLPADLHAQALQVIKEKDRPYWYGEEFPSPSALIERFGRPDSRWLYAQLSGAAHGSFMSLRLFREHPDRIDINAESPGLKALSVDLISCQLLAELLYLRDAVEELGMARTITEFIGLVSDTMLRRPPIA